MRFAKRWIVRWGILLNILIKITNSKNFKSAILRLISLFVFNIFPLYLIIKGIFRLFNGYIINIPFMAFHFIAPVVFIVCSFLAIRLKSAIGIKIVICSLLAILLLLNTLFFSLLTFKQLDSYYDSSAVEHYSEIHFKEMVIPSVSQLRNFEKIEYHYYESENFFSDAGTHILILQYDEKSYFSEKEAVNYQYYYDTKTANVLIDNFEFNMLSDEAYSIFYPKDVAFIATNDATHEIAYLRFFDVELDYISDMSNFILNECGWKYIR